MFYFAFNVGKATNQGSLNYCSSELDKNKKEVEEVQLEKIDLQKKIETLNIEKSILKEKYDKIIISDEALTLFQNINDKVKQGIDLTRISRVVNQLKVDRKCSKPIKKRFIVKTPLYKGEVSNTNVNFYNGLFDITASGYSSINDEKNPESWFDEEKEVSLSFNNKEGTEVVKQKLPIIKNIIVSNKEYFFEITNSNSRGFINIESFFCTYP
jgi:hypothetical protein